MLNAWLVRWEECLDDDELSVAISDLEEIRDELE